MFKSLKLFRIFTLSLILTIAIVAIKYLFHENGWEPIEQTSLHNSVISSVTFVMGFLLSATITDYKESERIPSDFASNLEDMYTDAEYIHKTYPKFDLEGFKKQLHSVAKGFSYDARKKTYDARKDIRGLAPFFAAMETGGVPPNFVVKLKQQQTQLLRSRQRVNYIQKIRFIPSATILARSIVVGVIVLLVLTNIDPFYGGLIISGIISFTLIYMLILIRTISTPFHEAGKTRDDVSLFLVNDAAQYLSKKK
jgi:hypothetical protein